MPEYIITAQEAGQKYTSFIARKCGIPLVLTHKLIRKGVLRINGKRAKPFTRLQQGDCVFLPLSLYESDKSEKLLSENQNKVSVSHQSDINISVSEQEIFLQNHIYYEDNELIVLNKPAGIPVHNGTRHSYSIASILHNLYSKAPFIPTLVHRLDKDTTGLLLIAKTYSMLSYLHMMWRENQVQKYYLAWVQGMWNEDKSKYITNAIHRGREKMLVTEGNDVSITVRCLQQARASSLLLIELHTGKTHQIRAQLAYHGFPLIGDSKYSNNSKKLPLFLHAVGMYITDALQYVILPCHWSSNFSLRIQFPQRAKDIALLF